MLSTSLSVCGLALVVEALVGYPAVLFGAIGHPVTWIGAGLSQLDRRLNRETDGPAVRRRLGAAALIGLLAICAFASIALAAVAVHALPHTVAILVLGVMASSCLAQRSLDAHVRAVADGLDQEGLPGGRKAVAAIVGRDTSALDGAGIARAAIESLAENFADGVVAPAVWLVLLGLPGGVLYKAINTADSMIGHRSARHEAFGFTAAKLDDLVNWPAARLAGLWLILASAFVADASVRDAWLVMWRDARGHASPNAGWPEAAMAGALRLRLGGPRRYGDRRVEGVWIGDGPRDVNAAAIRRALHLYRVACGLQILAVVVTALLIGRWR